MKRKFSFKATKYAIRSTFFTFYFIMKMLSKLIKYIQRIKFEATSDMGNCPHCKSLNIVYRKPYVTESHAILPFICENCGYDGEEHYTLKYVESVIIKEELDDIGRESREPRKNAGNTAQDAGNNGKNDRESNKSS